VRLLATRSSLCQAGPRNATGRAFEGSSLSQFFHRSEPGRMLNARDVTCDEEQNESALM
jgi:hypothetical protein